MWKRNFLIFLLTFTVFGGVYTAWSVEPTPKHVYVKRAVSAAQWNKLTDDKAYDYKDKVEHEIKKKTEPVVQRERSHNYIFDLLEWFFKTFVEGGGKIILWIVVIILALYILHKTLLSNESSLFGKKAKKMSGEEIQNLEEEGLEATNWEALLQKAVADKDLRAATRFAYMWTLQLLHRRQMISYRDDKTNYDYYKELAEPNTRKDFKIMCRQYEYVFYGNYEVKADTYNDFIAHFNKLRTQLGAK